MPYFRSVSYTTTGTKQSIDLDPSIVPFNAVIACTLVGAATGSYKLQYSLTPFTVADSDANWFDSGDIPASTTTSAVSSVMTPISRVRLVIASLTGTLTIETQQGLSTN